MVKGMNANARIAVAFGAGACFGAAGGFLLARHLLAIQAEERIASEVDDVKEHYGRRIDDLNRAHAAAFSNASGKGDNPLDGASSMGAEESPGADPRGGASAGRIDYRQSASGARAAKDFLPDEHADAGDVPGWAAGHAPINEAGPDDTDEIEDDSEDGEPAASAVVDKTKPYVIPVEEFEDDEGLNYTKISLTWYAGDGALIDEGEVPMRNPGELIGDTFAGKFGEESGDSRIVYIRNNRLSVDFEVKLHDGKYVDEILNYGKPK